MVSFYFLFFISFFLEELLKEIKSVKIYKNFKENKGQILKENKNKPGIYCLVNVSNGHYYIGSSINLSIRLRNYLNVVFFLTKKC